MPGRLSILDEQAARRIQAGQRPNITSCVLLANHFGVDPNEIITLAGWPEIDVFKVKTVSADGLPPEAVEVALDIAKIAMKGCGARWPTRSSCC